MRTMRNPTTNIPRDVPWWPDGAPVDPQRLCELTSRELGIITAFAESGPEGIDPARLTEFLRQLRAEADERRALSDAITLSAKAGRRTLV